jgi:hypothetical protein
MERLPKNISPFPQLMERLPKNISPFPQLMERHFGFFARSVVQGKYIFTKEQIVPSKMERFLIDRKVNTYCYHSFIK